MLLGERPDLLMLNGKGLRDHAPNLRQLGREVFPELLANVNSLEGRRRQFEHQYTRHCADGMDRAHPCFERWICYV